MTATVPGDVFSTEIDGKHHVFQVLRVDTFHDGHPVYHVRTFMPEGEEPECDEIIFMEVEARHVALESIDGSRFLGHRELSARDLDGFVAYLKETDVRRYLEETGRTVDDAIREARVSYDAGNAASDAGKFPAAIDHYARAIDAFPLFHEALDNMAFAYMDMAMWDRAIETFERSLRVEPRNVVALFSTGECYFKKRDHARAIDWFHAALAVDPGHQPSMEWLEKAKAARDGP